MPSPSRLHTLFAASTLLAETLALGQPPEHALGAFLAASATEFRWNLPLLALVGLTQLFSLRAAGGVRGAAWAAVLAGVLWGGAGFAEYTAAQTAPDGAGLWGAPLHLLLAGALPAGLCLYAIPPAGGRHSPRPGTALAFGVGASALGGLGLLWNFAQTGLQEGWAWDWIESGPAWVLLSLVGGTHLWARASAALSVAYIAFLGLSRTALITSAHHLQSPANSGALEPLLNQEVPASGVWGHPCGGTLSLTVLALIALARAGARAGAQACAAPRPAPLRRDHLGLALLPAALGGTAGMLGLTARGSAAQSIELRVLHGSFAIFFAAGLQLAWYGLGGYAPLPQPLGWLGAATPGLSAQACGALLLGAGWLHLVARARPVRTHGLASNAVCFPVSRFCETMGAWPGHVRNRSQLVKSFLGEWPL